MTRIFVTYTQDMRFPTLRLDHAFTTEEVAQARADKLNADDRANGVPETISYSHVVPLAIHDTLDTVTD